MSDDEFKLNRPKSRDVYQFIIRTGLLLEANDRTVCTAIMLTHRLLEKSIADNVCNHTLASTCIFIAGKKEEDTNFAIRDVVNASFRVLHPPPAEMLRLDEELTDLREGICRLEIVILRHLGFDTHVPHAFLDIYMYMDALRSWIPREFEEGEIAKRAVCILRDAYVEPAFILTHAPDSLAVTALSLALRAADYEVAEVAAWWEVVHKTMSEKKLRKLEMELLERVYGQNVD